MNIIEKMKGTLSKPKTPAADKPEETKTVDQLTREERKAEKEQKKKQAAEVKKAAAAARKAAKEEIKRDKEELYKLRKNRALRLARVVLWVMIAFLFIKGIVVSLRPDPTQEVNQTITEFRQELAGLQDLDNEILSFAENFAVNYFTYVQNGEKDYIEGLQLYATKNVIDAVAEIRFYNANCTVLYSQAYRREAYSPNQIDVYVLLNLLYEYKEGSGAEAAEHTEIETTIVKVPVYVDGSRYIVEDVPAFVNDSTTATTYQGQGPVGSEVNENTKNAVITSLSNFFRAYYEDEQNVINYFLTPEADPAQFMGLHGRVTFDKIQDCRVYYTTPEPGDKFSAVVTLTVTDRNGIAITQRFNITLVYKDSQYYIESMNVRIQNI